MLNCAVNTGGIRSKMRSERAADIGIVVAVVALLGLQVLLFLWNASMVWVPAIAVLLRWQHLSEHVHVHRPLLDSRFGKGVIDILLVLSTGVPVDIYYIHHVATHHRLDGTAQDWTSPFAFPRAHFPDRPVSMPQYVVTFFWRAWVRGTKAALAAERTVSLAASVGALVTLIVLGALCQPVGLVKFFVVPWFVLYLLAPVANWLHHSHCAYTSWDTAANSRFGLLNRTVGLNIGYHAAHHVDPDLHWTALPTLHRSLSDTRTEQA